MIRRDKIIPTIFFIALIIPFLLGCDPDINNTTKHFIAKQELSSTAHKVEETLSSLLAMDKNPARKEAMETAHRDWLKLRKSHCASQISQQDQKDNEKLSQCYEAFDNQRIDFLKQQKVKLLYEAPCLEQIPKGKYKITYPYEKGLTRGVPRSLVSASCAPIVAATFQNDMTEIYDIFNGQLLNRIKTLDTQNKSVGYNFILSPNGRILMCSFYMPKTELMMWDVMSGELLRHVTLNLGSRLLTKNGRYFIYAERNKISIYDIAEGTIIWTVDSKDWNTQCLALSHDEKYLIAARGRNIEYWELIESGDGRLSMNILAMEPAQDYHPISVVFAPDNKSFYSILHPCKMVERRVSDLKEIQRYDFSQFRHFTLKPINRTSVFLMETYPSSERISAFYIDVPGKTARKITEHIDHYTKLTSLSNGQMILAGVNDIQTLDVPEKDQLNAFGNVLGEVAIENVYINSVIKDAVKDIVKPATTDCDNFHLEAVGVYEGTLPGNRSRGFQEKISGHVEVNIGPTVKPLKLVLCSYEPVIWSLHLTSNAQLSDIYLSGSSESRVQGIENASVTYIGTEYAYAHSRASSRNGRRSSSSLASSVKLKTGCSIDNFQGAYQGSMFYVGRVTKGWSESKEIYKTVDEHGNEVFRNY